jgi:hypothetical protein
LVTPRALSAPTAVVDRATASTVRLCMGMTSLPYEGNSKTG